MVGWISERAHSPQVRKPFLSRLFDSMALIVKDEILHNNNSKKKKSNFIFGDSDRGSPFFSWTFFCIH